MAHKTLVNGTVYEIGGGKTLIDGVAYSIDKGKTLVGGTAYEVGFDDGMRTISFALKSGSDEPRNTCACAYINGSMYYEGDEDAIQVPVGTAVRVYVKDFAAAGKASIWHIKNGSVVYGQDTASTLTYEFNIEGSATITFNVSQTYNSSNKLARYGQITVTEIV